ncbi:MAG: hypothetical protein IT239_02105 [Bacteroidia bacterium]|nr:hypothetical protein [Bacteroidia bacterium]
MCRAIPTSNHNGGGNIANGLNSGIMYLLTIPYILVALLGIYFFRGSIAQWIKDVRYKKKIT